MTFSFIFARFMFTRFERLYCEVYALLHLVVPPKNRKIKKKRDGRQYKCNWEVAPSKGFGPLTDWLTASRSTGLSHDGATLLLHNSFKKTI